MDFCAQLPDKSAYKSLPVASDKDYFLFQDIASSAIRIKSPVANPFGKIWGIAFQHQRQKSYSGQYPYRLVIKLVSPSADAILCDFERRLEKGVYSYSRESPLSFISVPVPLDSGMYKFVTYSLYSKV